jgi:uncharacterized SAM-binding protein YcdF (DUF218 family)
VSVALNIGLAIILFTPLPELLYKPLIVDETPVPGEAIIILASAAYTTGLPGFRTMNRIHKGIEIYHRKLGLKIICAGGTRLPKANMTIAQAMRETLILYGIPPEDILLQNRSNNTYQDITFLLKQYHNDFDFNKAIFVTSSYHTYRVKRILLKKGLRSTVVSAHPWQLNPHLWSERLDMTREVVREYGAICYFTMRGYI